MDLNLAFQRRITKIALAAITDSDFALAGGAALREHGITHRPTEDIDLFSRVGDRDRFITAVDNVTTALATAGYETTTESLTEGANYARLSVTDEDGTTVMIDMGEDYRANDPVTLEIGSVISRTDSVASKVSTACTRTAVRDVIDLHYIRESAGHTDRELYEMAKDNDPGLDPGLFRYQLSQVHNYEQAGFDEYDVDAAERANIEGSLTQFCDTLGAIEKESNAPQRAPDLFAHTMEEQMDYCSSHRNTSSPQGTGKQQGSSGTAPTPPAPEPGGPCL